MAVVYFGLGVAGYIAPAIAFYAPAASGAAVTITVPFGGGGGDGFADPALVP